MDVRFLDTTFRDGSQSLWAMGIRHGMMEPIAADVDRAGFAHIEVPANPIFFKKIVRDLKEDPWATMKMLAEKIPETPKASMGAGFNINPLGTPNPPQIGRLFWSHLFKIGALQRIQMIGNTMDQLSRDFPRVIPELKEIGMEVAIALSYSISPRHTDEHYARKTRESAALNPDVIYLKDQGGMLTVDRLRTLVPIMIENAGGIPFELHSHCTMGLAPSVYMEAISLGVGVVHTGIPPLAEGSAQPSILNVARNVRSLGHHTDIDDKLLESVADRLTRFAQSEKLPLGQPSEYNQMQFVHQIPGGVISNLKFQLATVGLEERLDEVVAETVEIRRELGYPIMITPYSQHICTQAAMNVASGERYSVVIDEMIRFAQGVFGEDSGYLEMDQNVKDKFLSLPRAAELADKGYTPPEDLSPDEVRAKLGEGDLSDEELLLRTIMQGEQEIESMRRAGQPKSYSDAGEPITRLMEELKTRKSIRHLNVQRGEHSLTVQK